MSIDYAQCALFSHMNPEDVRRCLSCSGAQVRSYDKDEAIFEPMDKPKLLYVLLDGGAFIGRDDYSGRRSLVMEVKPYDIFGESYLFLNELVYEDFAVATKKSDILEIPKDFLYNPCGKACRHHIQFIYNMLSILSGKNFLLNNKIRLLSAGSLRSRILKYLAENCDENGCVLLTMNREQFAGFPNVERPSLSRELMKLKRDGVISVERGKICILDFDCIGEL